MFKSLFSTSKPQTSNRKPKDKTGLVSKRDGIVERKVMEGAERELYQYDQPKQGLGMTDLVKKHEEGSRFMYAVITGREPEDIASKMRRLTSFQPILKKKAVPIDNLPTIRLFKETESFPLDQVLPKQKAKGYGEYVRIADIMTMYGAIVSPDCHFTKIQVGITDNRLMEKNLVKSFTATSNMASKGNLSLSYCVPIEDIDQLILTISRERSFIAEGRQWGALQLQLVVEFMAFPMQMENQTVVAQNMLPPSTLENPLVDPNHVDISILNNNRDDLHQFFLSGDLVDETEPITDRTEIVKYAKSTMRTGQKKGQKIEVATNDWDFMKDSRKNITAGLNSIEPSEDGSLKAASDREEGSEVEADQFIRPPTPIKHSRNVSFGGETVIEKQINEPPRSRTNNIEKLTPF